MMAIGDWPILTSTLSAFSRSAEAAPFFRGGSEASRTRTVVSANSTSGSGPALFVQEVPWHKTSAGSGLRILASIRDDDLDTVAGPLEMPSHA